jgi:hypothetical protein
MRRTNYTLAALALALLLTKAAHAQEARPGDEQVKRDSEIQAALREANLDGWLFYDFRRSDPLAYRILRLPTTGVTTRRWFYYVPVVGEPVRVVHSIERYRLDALPGRKIIYASWEQLHAAVRDALASGGLKS